MDSRSVADELIGMVSQLSDPERLRLRDSNELLPQEAHVLMAALANRETPVTELAGMVVNSWGEMTEAERIASLLAIRQILVHQLLTDCTLRA